MSGVIVCSVGCCQGCSHCMGSQIGCHARPCRCSLPCSCDFRMDEPDTLCRRHQFRADQGIVSPRRVQAREAMVLALRFEKVMHHSGGVAK